MYANYSHFIIELSTTIWFGIRAAFEIYFVILLFGTYYVVPKVGRFYWNPFGRLILIFLYVLAAQISAGQAGPKFNIVCQRVWKNNSRDLKKIWLLKQWYVEVFEKIVCEGGLDVYELL